MNIVVCVKQVPDTAAVKIDPKTGTLIRDGVPSIMNPEDKHALEAALQIKETNGLKCYEYLNDCLLGKNLKGCKRFLTDINFMYKLIIV